MKQQWEALMTERRSAISFNNRRHNKKRKNGHARPSSLADLTSWFINACWVFVRHDWRTNNVGVGDRVTSMSAHESQNKCQEITKRIGKRIVRSQDTYIRLFQIKFEFLVGIGPVRWTWWFANGGHFVDWGAIRSSLGSRLIRQRRGVVWFFYPNNSDRILLRHSITAIHNKIIMQRMLRVSTTPIHSNPFSHNTTQDEQKHNQERIPDTNVRERSLLLYDYLQQ